MHHFGRQAGMDGELVIVGDNGKPDFQALRGYFPDSGLPARMISFNVAGIATAPPNWESRVWQPWPLCPEGIYGCAPTSPSPPFGCAA